jgi:hypothetical protein
MLEDTLTIPTPLLLQLQTVALLLILEVLRPPLKSFSGIPGNAPGTTSHAAMLAWKGHLEWRGLSSKP